jgi:hypothetical protein
LSSKGFGELGEEGWVACEAREGSGLDGCWARVVERRTPTEGFPD